MPRMRTIVHVLSEALTGCLHRSVKLFAPDITPPDPADASLIDRITTSLRRMKEDEGAAPTWCQPASIWREQINTAFAPLKNESDAAGFLSNFGAWPLYTGIEEAGFQIQRYGKHWIGRRYVEESFFRKPLSVWRTLEPARPLSRLSFPRHGNQAGAFFDGQFISPGAPFNDLIGQQLATLVEGISRPVLAEIGGGYGKLAYCVLRDLASFQYIGFDLPETLCTAAYYLGKSFPDHSMLLYGEGDFSTSSADIILMPAWEIERLPAKSVDCFFNKNSLGEMTPATARSYITHIARTTRGTFFHMNHDRVRCAFPDGGAGLLASEYPLPLPFRLVSREPDHGHLVSQGGAPDIFQYLWRRHDELSVMSP